MHEIADCFETKKAVVAFVPHGGKYLQAYLREMATRLRESLPKAMDATYVDVGGTGVFEAVVAELKKELSTEEQAMMFPLRGSGGLRELRYASLGALVMEGDRSFSRVPLNRECVLYGYRASEADTGAQGVALVNDVSNRARLYDHKGLVVVEALEDGSIPPAFWNLSSHSYLRIVNLLPAIRRA